MNWYIKLADGRIQGPYKEGQIRRGIHQGTIRAEMMIRQEKSAWIKTIRVKQLFDRLDNEGFYLRFASGKIAGPFTEERVRKMNVSGELPTVCSIRRGKTSEWTTLDTGSNRSGSVTRAVRHDARMTARLRVSERETAVARPDAARISEVVPTPDTQPKPGGTTDPSAAHLESVAGAEGCQSTIPAAPVMKLRCNTWIERWNALMEQLETMVLGDPLNARNPSLDNAVTTANEFQQTHPAESGIPRPHHGR